MRNTRIALVAALVIGCGPHNSGDRPDGGGGGDDAGAGDDGGVTGDGGCACAAPEVCRFSTCIDPPASCASDDDCQDDSYCDNGECIPYPLGPRGNNNMGCKRPADPAFFSPQPQCSWPGTNDISNDFPQHTNVLTTPLVADFDFDNDPKTVQPSIVFVTYNCTDGACGAQPGCSGVIRVIDGKTCKSQYSMSAVGLLIGSVTPAIGDLDGDGRPDIVAAHQGGGIAGFKYDKAQNKFVEMWPGYSSAENASCHWDSLALADLDDDGVPEVLEAGPNPAAFDNKGQLIDAFATNISYSDLLHPVVADVDGDGKVELVDGREGFRFDPATKKWQAAANIGGTALGQVALADFGTFTATASDRTKLDGIPEVVIVSAGQARIQRLDGTVIFGPVPLPTTGGHAAGTGGAPTVADFDGDGRAEFGVAGASAYAVFDPDCAAGATATVCPSQTQNGILWLQASQDFSSNVTGSSVFDFNGDGAAEVVYADECFSRVYDGKTGAVEFSQFHTSCTWYENPIVADVAGNFRSAIVIPSNVNCNVSCPSIDPIHQGVSCDSNADCPGTTTCVKENAGDAHGLCRCATDMDCAAPNLACVDPIAGPSPNGKVCRASHPQGVGQNGVLVLHDALDRWVSSRTIWNQHAYAVTNINDDGTVPKTSAVKANWKDPTLNNFRMNVQGALKPGQAADLTAASDAPPGMHTQLACDAGTLHLKARVCNRGTGVVAPGVPVTFYDGSNMKICTTATVGSVTPGACEVVGCDWANAPTNPTDVGVAANDDGSSAGTLYECDKLNDRCTLRGVYCGTIL
jgi:hypothetical protein